MFTTVARWFRLKIRGQLLLAMFIAAMLVALVAVSMETITHTRALRLWATLEAQSVADAMSNDFLKLILIGDPDSAANLAKQLTSFPLIHSLVVHNSDGEALFQFRRDTVANLAPNDENPAERFAIAREISDQGTLYGRVELTISGAKLSASISDYYNYLAVVVLALLLISVASAAFFQRFFTGPVLHLTRFMHRVTLERDFGLRITNNRSDEFGVLNGGVNKLLAEMQNAQRNLLLRNQELGTALQRLQLESRAKENALHAMLQATSANREKSAFLANMSHELRTPLNAIIGYSELLDEDAVSAGNTHVSADLHKIRGAGLHLLSLVNDVLDLSKIEAGKMSLDLASFDAGELVNETLIMIEPLLGRGRNRLEKYIAVTGVVMRSDPIRIRQVLFNLLSNACKFTHDGTITVTVAPGADAEHIHFSVRDTGEGIAAADLQRLFQPFVQVESAGHKHEGTGLGLALCGHFCKMLGGEIHARSVCGQGSEFYFWLPLHTAGGELHGR
ncbi:MAG: HAMP domain-containing histidine kinase [Gammaproteobacteria bacterium]|nr:HAMP domain-containing histidine kinase [Gammaproteobacteria bacterium]